MARQSVVKATTKRKNSGGQQQQQQQKQQKQQEENYKSGIATTTVDVNIPNNNNMPTSSSKSLKILIVTPAFPPFVSVGGGVAITYGALYDKLVERGHLVSVASPRLGNLDYGSTPLYLGHPVIYSSRYNLKFLAKLFEENDVIVCPDNDILPFLIFLSHLKGKPLLFNTHTNFRMILEGGPWVARNIAAPIMDGMCNWCSNLAPFTFTTSPSYRDVMESKGYKVDGVFSPRIKLGIFERSGDTEEEILAAREWLTGGVLCEFVFISVGRWSHEKRIPLLANAVPENCCLAIVGDGPAMEVKAIEALHNLKNRVVVHRGIVDQDRLRVLYKASDFVVSASAFETLGMTVAEAHLCGTPAIVQTAPGFTTQVVHGENGFLVDFAAEDILKTVQSCVAKKPTKQQIDYTLSQRWDSRLPNLEDVVEDIAGKKNRNEWNCIGSSIPIPIWWILIVFYYFFYKAFSYPFLCDRKNSEGLPLRPNPGSKRSNIM